MGVILFAVGNFAALLLAAAVAIWGFGKIEPMWGAGGSFVVSALVAALCSFAAVVAFGLGSVLLRKFASNRISLAAGAVSALVAVSIVALLPWQQLAVGMIAPPVVFAGVGWVAAAVAPWLGS